MPRGKTEGASPAAAKGRSTPVLSAEALRRLYAEVMRLRTEARRGKEPSGREAVLAGALFDLEQGDLVSNAAGDTLGERAGARVCGVIPAPDEGWRLAVATGAAMAQGAGKSGRVTLAFAGGELPAEVLRFAGERQAPIVFVTELQKQGGAVENCGFPAIPVDIDDAVAIYRVAHESIFRARQGGGPTVIACVPYRLDGQSGPERRDTVKALRQYLRGRGLSGRA
jgi:hypothetical protein